MRTLPHSRGWRSLIQGICGVLILAVAFSIFGLWRKRESYADYWLAKAWASAAQPPRIQRSDAEPTSSRLPKLLLLGDSRIAEWGTPPLSQFRVLNAGAGGMTTAELKLVASDLIEEHRPDVVLIQAGINDLKVLGVRHALKQPLIDHCVTNLMETIHSAQSRGAQVLVSPIWPTGSIDPLRRLVWSRDIEEAVDETNQKLKQATQSMSNVVWVPFFTSDSSAPAKPGWWHRDALHFTPQAYAWLTQELERYLKSLPRIDTGS